MVTFVIFNHFQDIRCWNLPWPLELVKVKCKDTNRKPFLHFQDICCGNKHDLVFDLNVQVKVKGQMLVRQSKDLTRFFIFDGNSYVCHIFRNFQDIYKSKCTLPWPWPFKMVKAKCVYINRNSIHDFLFDGSNHFYLICHHLHDIHCQNMPTLDLQNKLRSNVSLPFEIPYIIWYLMLIVICSIFVANSKIFIIEIWMTLTREWHQRLWLLTKIFKYFCTLL